MTGGSGPSEVSWTHPCVLGFAGPLTTLVPGRATLNGRPATSLVPRNSRPTSGSESATPDRRSRSGAETQHYERLSAGDLSVVDELVSADFIEHEPVPGLTPTKEGVRQLFEMFHSAFDHAAIQIDDLIAEGDKVFALARMTGHHRGEFMGVPASGNTIDVGVCDLFRVDNGAIVEHWGIMDAASMMHQLTA